MAVDKTPLCHQKQAAYTDVIVAALASGLTNVMTYTIDDLGTKITTLPENKEKTNIHAVDHERRRSRWTPPPTCRMSSQTHHMKQVHTLVTKLKSYQEGNGTMFDNTTIIYMPETGAGHHGPDNSSMVLMTGKIQSSILPVRYIRPLPWNRRPQDISELVHHTAQRLWKSDRTLRWLGRLTMQRKRFKQTGAIDRFLT